AVIVTENATPAVVDAGAVTWRCVATEGATFTSLLVPVMPALTVSVAVTVRLPTVRRTTVKVPVPLVRVAFWGRSAWASLLVSLTVPVSPVAGLLAAPRAGAVTVTGTAAVAVAGIVTLNFAAAVGAMAPTEIDEVPVMSALTVSVAVRVWVPLVL